jgi:glucose-6-phosphate 1-dehydrogenase
MPAGNADALVILGAGGDLAAKMIYPALQALARQGRLAVPVIGVGRAGWDNRDIDGVVPDSDAETFVALRLAIDSPRWRGVPFFIRAGKALPLTTTEVWIELAPAARRLYSGEPAHFRFRLGPGKVEIGIGVAVGDCAANARGTGVELQADLGSDKDCDAYERLLGDALRGDRTVFERAAAIMAAWRVVDPVQEKPPPVAVYAKGSWGPQAAAQIPGEGERWHDPEPKQ